MRQENAAFPFGVYDGDPYRGGFSCYSSGFLEDAPIRSCGVALLDGGVHL
jgi:hypothetical protein